MLTNKYIIWQDSFDQDDSILDEQHRAILATVNSLYYFLQQGQGLDVLMPTVKILIDYLVFHSKTEEGILRAAEYPELDSYIEGHNKMIKDFKKECREALVHKDPQLVLAFLKQWWQSHLDLHHEMAPYIVKLSGQYCRVD